MTSKESVGRRRAVQGAAMICALLTGAAIEALPASAHASIPTAPTFGFAPNTAGGTGALGTTSPYVPGAFTTIYLRAAGEQSVAFNGAADTNVDVRAIVPAGWTDPQCGPAKAQVNNASTNNTNQPGADVPGWTCEVLDDSGHKVVRWSGPQVVAPATVEDSPAFFVFSVTTPSPTVQTTYDGTGGTEGFIVDQKYASGALSHWIPNAAYPGVAPVGTTRTDVATGLVRTVAGPGTGFTSVSPTRILDSRGSIGGWSGPLTAAAPRSLTVTGGTASVPADVDAVVVNITATNASAASYVTAYPTGSAAPNASNLNFAAGQDVAGLAVVKVGTAGQINFANAVGSTDVVVDLVGYFSSASAGRYNALDPTRLLDSRSGIGGWSAKLAASVSQTVQVRGAAGVPSTATSVVVNLTATGPTAGSYLTVYPSGESAPTASNLNVAANQTLANLVMVKIGTDGKIAIRNDAGSTDVIADVVGYYDTTGDLFHSLAPRRVLDSRLTAGGWNSPLLAGTPRVLAVKGISGVRVDAHSFIANATVTGTTTDGYLTVYPTGATQPNASTLNYSAGSTVPNLIASKVGSGGQVSFAAASGSTNVLLDVVGYFAAS